MPDITQPKNEDKFKICWICGKEADSFEHLFKASDFDSRFPNVSKKNKIYGHNIKTRNRFIQSKNSKLLTSKTKVCKKCNNELTQPYDKAWEQLSNYFHRNINNIRKTRKFNLSTIYPGDSKNKSIYLQLYFIKITGLLLYGDTNDSKIYPILAQSIRNGTPRSDIFLRFCLNRDEIYGMTRLSANSEFTEVEWGYCLGRISITVTYLEHTLTIDKKSLGWQPENKKKTIKLKDSNYELISI